jgi:type I restriction-modification system DNA methylase subunit
MHWIAPSEKNADNAALEKRLWDAADQLRANSELKSQEYSAPVLGLIFLRFAEVRFTAQRAALEKASTSSRRGSRVDEPAAYHAEGILYAPEQARNYAQHFPKCQVIFVSNGYCYKAYRRTKNGFSSEPSAYLNIRDPRDAYPLNPKIPGALEVLRLLLKGT